MAKFLANENIPGDAVQKARAAGIDIQWVKEIMRGATDDAILARAVKDKRVLLTFDRDFGELVFAKGKEASCGVILLRVKPTSPGFVASFVVAVLTRKIDWAGGFAVVTEDRVRTLPVPARSGKG